MIGGGDRRQILVAFDGFLAAQLAAAQDEDRRRQGDEAADDDAKSSVLCFHDVIPNVRSVTVVPFARCAPGFRQKPMQNSGHFMKTRFGGRRARRLFAVKWARKY